MIGVVPLLAICTRRQLRAHGAPIGRCPRGAENSGRNQSWTAENGPWLISIIAETDRRDAGGFAHGGGRVCAVRSVVVGRCWSVAQPWPSGLGLVRQARSVAPTVFICAPYSRVP